MANPLIVAVRLRIAEVDENIPIPNRPRLATARPMTEPPRNRHGSARPAFGLGLPVRPPPSDVRPRGRRHKPKKPASIEQSPPLT